ncbi:tRNA (adenosine(37)-N6)-threonylcarbamoyltransferase complex dimerization subunit type 1 TsaB [Streptococcus oricebi]|uniref:tRNA (Adenosine(37)-N6)-threonylcarbamoyltransferase complex dimerization subunit type 1 TsaB n=1 Tax=Streptococcus oricebi TaxID=1547447 RepID=A0ABS5B4L2_9STRE|nr:tRNA (adenosine(37)-N6)-threonylcarbamoyltransferase complex dimerization subunit type 1 TsaB [Streptococcus oricebi]MBP2623767.1 tRNA (adenosine(37)-N6)-threonylcarbamoyltransferase complex dimerization subunit type 1 TsaB [Streptococcus oricebi]
MKILAFDTSNKALSLAITEDDQVLGKVTLNIKKNHSVSLMPSLDFLMQSLDLKPEDLDRIVVAEGPGSYTGLRVAVATAKTLAYSLKIDLVGVSSLRILVADDLTGLVIPLMDARRNNVYAGFYQEGEAVREEAHLSLAEVLDFAKDFPDVSFVGEVEAFTEQIRAALPTAKIKPSLADATCLARLGAQKESQAIHDFTPNYLKRVEAEENWLKNHQETEASYIKRL